MEETMKDGRTPRCQRRVARGSRRAQCTRAAVDGDHCRVHSETLREAGMEREKERWRDAQAARRVTTLAPMMVEVLKKIADGQGDPVELACEALRKVGP